MNYYKSINIYLKKLIFIFIIYGFMISPLWSLEFNFQQIYKKDNFIYIQLNADGSTLSEDILKNLNYGITLDINFQIDVYETGLIFDQIISTKKVVKTIKFDRWSGLYLLTHNKNKLFKNSQIKKLENEIINFSQTPIINQNLIKDDKTYYIKMKVTFNNKNFHPYYHLINNFFIILKNQPIIYQSKPILGENIK